MATTAAPSIAADPASAEQITRGKYLTQLGGCMACHTAKNGAAYTGGLYIDTPFGKIASSNITPDKATGIGAWSDDEFYRAMHDGIGRHGEYLYPVMPYPWYTKVTRDDVAAIKAYLFTLPAVRKERAPLQLRFPFSIRESLLAWRVAFFKAGTFEPDETKSAEINRGAYLVNGLGHCGECHNSLPVTGDSKWSKRLQGNVIENWYAPNITSDVRDGIGGWRNEDLAEYLKKGFVPGKGVALGPMAETVHALGQLSEPDLLAIAAYLKSTPAVSDGKDAKSALYQGTQARGAEPYLSHCASCHGTTGKGLADAVPALDGSSSVMAGGPQNVISIVLGGIEAHGNYGPMPAVGAGMSDQEIADAANYVRQLGGNTAPATAEAGMVATIRASTDTLLNAGPREGCPPSDVPAVARAVAAPAIAAQLRGVTEADMYAQTQRLVAAVKKAAPRLGQADLINGLTAAYCPVVRSDPQLDANAKALKLGHFGQLVYSAASGGGVRVNTAATKPAAASAQSPARR